MPAGKKTAPKKISVDGVFDIECYGWDKFKLGVTMTSDGDIEIHRTPQSMVDTMIFRGGSWWGHNGGKYDALQVLEILRLGGIAQSISLSQSRVTRSVGSGLMLRDSYALVPLGLESLAEMGGKLKPKLWFDCKCGEDCGGYCMIRPKMSYLHEKRLEEYCVMDCEALYAGLNALSEFAVDNDFDLTGTIGGSAWSTAKRALGLPDADFSPSQWACIRTAYFGGRCSVFRPVVHAAGTHWDMGSAYPAALSESQLPVGELTERGKGTAGKALANGIPGIYSCRVFVPSVNVPPLPTGWGTSGLAFAIGEVSGVWSLPEIIYAESVGARIESVEWAMTWNRTENIFGDWIRRIYRLRVGLDKESAWGKWLRLFPNSCVGKMAERPDKRFLRMNPDLCDIRLCSYQSPCSESECSGFCGAWEQLDKWGHMWSVPFYKPSPSAHVHWAAYVTAASRIAHAKAIASHGDHAVYCDTDSLWTTSPNPPRPTGDGLGEWSLKATKERSGTFSEWEGPAPKCYAYTDGKTGERIISSAGAHIKPAEWTTGDSIQDRGVLSILDASRAGGGLFRRAHRKWTIPQHGEWYGDRRITSSGMTRPVTVPELRIRLNERSRESAARRKSTN